MPDLRSSRAGGVNSSANINLPETSFPQLSLFSVHRRATNLDLFQNKLKTRQNTSKTPFYSVHSPSLYMQRLKKILTVSKFPYIAQIIIINQKPTKSYLLGKRSSASFILLSRALITATASAIVIIHVVSRNPNLLLIVF